MKRLTPCLLFVVCIAALVRPASLSAGGERRVEIVLDASGSMAGRLPGGKTKLQAAQAAVAAVVPRMAPETLIALRAYGHQSPRVKHDCRDTRLLVPFGAVREAGRAVVEKAARLTAQGYTPITTVIGLAAGDFPAETAGERVIVLVSDGKETCEGDPCATARALAASGACVVIHTVGFDVDLAARSELECVARAGGGSYFDAADPDALADVLGKAVVAPASALPAPASGTGTLVVSGANIQGHAIIDAAGKVVATAGHTQEAIELPAGVYQVEFGPARWKGVVVEAGKKTILQPGVLEVKHAAVGGHQIADSETGLVHGAVSAVQSTITLLPGTYDVTFGGATWRGVKVPGGGTTVVLQPGIIRVPRADINGHLIYSAAGEKVGQVSATGDSIPVPPGDYTVAFGKIRKAVTVHAGEEIAVER